MRTIALVLASLLAASVCLALDITTRKGVTYKQATVTKVEADGVRINHADGAARILFEDLPDALQRQYNYDPAKVAAYRQQVADARKAAADQAAAELRQRQDAAERAARQAREQEEERRASARRAEEAHIAAEESRKAIDAFVQFFAIGAAIIAGLFVYFIPSIVGRRKRNAGAIFVMNLFLGWIFIGWVIALIWACTKDSSMEALADQHLDNLSRRGRDPYPDRLPRGRRGPYLE